MSTNAECTGPVRTIVLIGASVGKAWRIEQFPERVGLPHLRINCRPVYRFDKSSELESVLAPGSGPPDAVILKECAAYFPGNQEEYAGLMRRWIEACRAAGSRPIPATVAPIVRPAGLLGKLREAVLHSRGKTAAAVRLAGLLRFNDWVREWSGRENLQLLDLEQALRVCGQDRSLRPDLHSGDGLHLNGKAYALLDNKLKEVMEKAFPRG